jgi:hypothetical protein
MPLSDWRQTDGLDCKSQETRPKGFHGENGSFITNVAVWKTVADVNAPAERSEILLVVDSRETRETVERAQAPFVPKPLEVLFSTLFLDGYCIHDYDRVLCLRPDSAHVSDGISLSTKSRKIDDFTNNSRESVGQPAVRFIVKSSPSSKYSR